MEDHHFAWILWYIWKVRNNMVFSNIVIDPRDTINLAETEATLWLEAQANLSQRTPNTSGTELSALPQISGRWCFTDNSQKDKDNFSRQGWYITLEGFNELMGARNTRTSLSPLHSEVEALIWAMESMRNLRQFHVTFATDFLQLVKMVSDPTEWSSFYKLSGGYFGV